MVGPMHQTLIDFHTKMQIYWCMIVFLFFSLIHIHCTIFVIIDTEAFGLLLTKFNTEWQQNVQLILADCRFIIEATRTPILANQHALFRLLRLTNDIYVFYIYLQIHICSSELQLIEQCQVNTNAHLMRHTRNLFIRIFYVYKNHTMASR